MQTLSLRLKSAVSGNPKKPQIKKINDFGSPVDIKPQTMQTQFLADTDRLYRAIGKVVVEFQFVEYTAAEILSSILQMRDQEDQHRISAAMSFRQKVDLLCDLYPLRKNPSWLDVDLPLTRKCLYGAEDFRNRVVHSFWHVAGTDEIRWMRTKASLRSSGGLRISAGVANTEALEHGAEAIQCIRDWYLNPVDKLQRAANDLQRLAKNLNF